MKRLLFTMVLALSPIAAACNVTASAGSNVGGGGGAGGGDAGIQDSDCTAPKPTCLYGVPSHCKDYGGGPVWECEPTPLVLSFDREDVTFTAATSNGFDLIGEGARVESDWPTAATPWLALDRNHDGRIEDATELFGSAVRLASGVRATNGFEALAELDDNGDGRIDAKDGRFDELALWADVDQSRSTERGELVALSTEARRVVSIELHYRVAPSCDARGNCGIERASFEWMDAFGAMHVGEVVDVHLPLR